MMGKRRFQCWRLAAVMFMIAAASGCTDGLRVGQTWVIPSRGPLRATHIQITRHDYERAAKQRSGEQSLEVSLFDGRATLTDESEKVYPSQLPDELTDQLETMVVSRQFNVGRYRAVRDASQYVEYAVVVYNSGEPVSNPVRWATPSQRPLPKSLELLTRVFERSGRMAEPLSRKYNLVE